MSKDPFFKAKRRIQLLVLNDKFQRKVSDIRNDFNIPKNAFDSDDALKKWVDDLITNTDSGSGKNIFDFNRAIKKLMQEFDFSDHYYHFFLNYIRRNIVSFIPSLVRIETVCENGVKSLRLDLSPEATLKDTTHVSSMFRALRKWWPKLRGKYKKLDSLDRGKRILELSRQNNTNRQISDIIFDESGERIMYFEIPKIRAKFLEYVNKP